MNFLKHLLLAALDRTRTRDYWVLFAIGAVPVALAWYLGVHDSYEVDGLVYIGYFDKHNFWTLTLLNPAALWLLRREYGRIVTISPERLPEQPPAIIKLFQSVKDRESAYQMMRTYLSRPRVMGTVLALAAMINILDTRELLGVYVQDNPVRQDELDWSVMYQFGLIEKWQNAGFVMVAYINQVLITWIGVFAVVFLFYHNLFFLNRIYQRRTMTPDEEPLFINLDLDDVNKCFGFREANAAFNTQVYALIIGGLCVLVSRFANVGYLGQGTSFLQVLEKPTLLGEIITFPDAGQVLLGVFWVLAFCIVASPALVKLLPRFPMRGNPPEMTITNYLREFLSDDQWPFGDNPTKKEVDYMAAKFAENSFWPTGDNRASQLFFFSMFVTLLVLYPIKTPDLALFLFSMLFLAAIAWILKNLIFLLLGSSLAFVDERLINRRPELIEEVESQRIRIRSRVFISYRREDTAPYARLIRQSLGAFMDTSEIFMDIETINDGDDFVNSIEEAVSNCHVMLVLIGKQWADMTDEAGNKRLFNDDDFVRLEIAAALQLDCQVIPVLVGGAEMPRQDQLPPNINDLWRRHSRELSDTRWDYDCEQLAMVIADG